MWEQNSRIQQDVGVYLKEFSAGSVSLRLQTSDKMWQLIKASRRPAATRTPLLIRHSPDTTENQLEVHRYASGLGAQDDCWQMMSVNKPRTRASLFPRALKIPPPRERGAARGDKDGKAGLDLRRGDNQEKHLCLHFIFLTLNKHFEPNNPQQALYKSASGERLA